MQPASLAKIMTFYLSLDALKAGKISPSTDVTISEAAWRLSMNDTVSRMFLGVGQKVAVNDLLYGLMVSSGNDAAVALSEYLGGSTDAFTKMMNDKASAIGLKETHFNNPDGLPEEGEFTTAADMVALAHSLVNHHPEALTYTSAKEFTFDKISQPNFNKLLLHDRRVNGIKTGHVDEAGYHLVASATSDGMNLLSAVLGAPSEARRVTESEKLIDWAFRTFVSYRPDLKKAMPPTIPVHDGVAETVAIGPHGDAVFTLGRGEETKVTVQFEPSARYVEAPVQPGDAGRRSDGSARRQAGGDDSDRHQGKRSACWILRPPEPEDRPHAVSAARYPVNSSSITFASRRSLVSNPSVNCANAGASAARASSRLPVFDNSRARLVAARSLHDFAPWRTPISIARRKHRSASMAPSGRSRIASPRIL